MRSLLTVCLTVLCMAVAGSPVPVAAADRPNVLFIAIDDLNDWIGCMGGHPQGHSPHIDALAKRGTLFMRAYCGAPACNPSRVSLMTGVRPSTSGIYFNSDDPQELFARTDSLPQLFRKAGYKAVGSGKIYHGRFEDDESWNDYLRKSPDPRPSREVLDDPRSRSGGIIWGVLDVDDSEMSDYKMVDYAIDVLSRQHDQPFFLGCGIFRPHMPWQVPRKYYEMFPLESIQLPKVLENDLDDIPAAGVRMARPEGDHRTMLETGNWKHAVQAYLASVAFADAQIGRLLAALDASPYADNTIIVLWGDHGWHHGQKQHWRKFALWEQATRTPLIIAAPGAGRPGAVCHRAVDLLGVYPTLAELCGLAAPPQKLEGQSLVPLLRNPESEWPHAAITTHGPGNHAVRLREWRYIRYANGDEELYNLNSDPYEWTNLADRSDLAELRAELARWIPADKEAPAPRQRQNADRKSKKAAGR